MKVHRTVNGFNALSAMNECSRIYNLRLCYATAYSLGYDYFFFVEKKI